MPDEPKTGEEPDVSASSAEQPPVDTSVSPETITLSKVEVEELRKKAEVGENYKQENEKYRKLEKEGRLSVLKPTEEATFDVADTIPILFEKDRQEVLDTIVQEFSEVASEDQWTRFREVYPGIESLKQEAILSGKPISRVKIEKRVKSFIDYAKGSDTTQVEKARTEGALEVIKANSADIGTMSGTSKKQTTAGVTQEDIEYSEASSGQITPERAKEIRENRERRNKEW